MTPLARAVSLAILGIGVWAMLFGVQIIAGGTDRMQSPAFAVIRGTAEMAHVDPALFWGGSLTACGLLVLVRRTEQIGLFVSVVWCALFAFGAAAAAVADPAAGVTGHNVYGLVAVMISGLIAVRRSGLAPRVPL